jgi:hypothetical protein
LRKHSCNGEQPHRSEVADHRHLPAREHGEVDGCRLPVGAPRPTSRICVTTFSAAEVKHSTPLQWQCSTGPADLSELTARSLQRWASDHASRPAARSSYRWVLAS